MGCSSCAERAARRRAEAAAKQGGSTKNFTSSFSPKRKSLIPPIKVRRPE